MKVFSQLKYLRPAFGKIKKMLIVVAFITILISLIALIPPYLGKYLFDEGVVTGNVDRIIYYGLLIIATYALFFVLGFIAQVIFSITSNRFTVEMKNQALERLLKLPMEFFDKKQSGYLANRLNEVDALSGLFSPTIFQFFSGLIQLAGALSIMISISKSITLVALLFVPFFYLITRTMSHRVKKTSHALMETSALMRGNLQENISGIPEIKQFNAESSKRQEMTKQFISVASKRIRQAFTLGMGTQSLGLLSSVAGVVVLILSGIYITRGQLSIGDYMALAGYTTLLFMPVQSFGSFSLTIQPVLAALARLSVIFKEKIEGELWGDKNVKKIEGTIIFKNVFFKYQSEKNYILKECNFSIAKSDCVAILGKNGAGKSTLVKLLLGFYPNYQGQILVDNTELHKYNIISFRKRIGIVSQNIVLFTGSLESNVKMAHPQATEEDMERAYTLSGCKEIFDKELSEVRISETGRNLSGGERQAVAIARCLLKNPDIIIFDEATAHLDKNTCKLVMQAFKDVFVDKTRILITHDQDIAKFADRILLLEKGTVKVANHTLF